MSRESILERPSVAGARDLVKAVDFRRAIGAGVLYLLCVVAVGTIRPAYGHHTTSRLLYIGVVFATTLPGVFAVKATAAEVHQVVAARGTRTAAGSLRLLLSLLGFAGIALISLLLLAVPLGRLLLSGAVTGVVLGIAAQQTLSNLCAGLVLLLSRPFRVGDRVIIRSGALGGPFEGDVIDLTLLYTQLATDEGLLSLPNSGVLAAATGVTSGRALRPTGTAAP